MFIVFINSIPPGNMTSWRRCHDIALYLSATSQVRLKWNTQRRLSGASARRLSGTSTWRLKQVSNKTPNDVWIVHHQEVSVVRTHDVLLVRLYDVSCNSQMKHPITSLRHVSTTSRSYVVVTPYLYYGLCYVFRLLCQDLHMQARN